MKKWGKLVKVVSVLILWILGKLLDYYISNHTDKTDFWIKFLDNQLTIKVVWAIVGSIITIIILTEVSNLIISPYEEKISEKKKEIQEKNRLLELKTGTLVTKLKDLFSFYEKELLFNHLRKLTDKNSIIHCAQIYTYSKNINNEVTTIKVKYVNGCAFEDIDINAMIQNYYKIPNAIYFDINDILEKVKKLDAIETKKNLSELQVSYQMEETIRGDIEDKIDGFIRKYLPTVQNKNLEELDEVDSILLSMIELCFEINIKIRNEYDNDVVYSVNVFDDDINNNVLRSIKRTGILAGILKINAHVFMNNGYSKKKGRIYVTRCFELNGKEYVILLSLLPNITNFPNWRDLVNNIINDFEKSLKKDTEIMYTSSIEGD